MIHVRRGDVVLHGKFSRAYHKISEYLQTARHLMSPNILLLTDDANAVTEALAHRKLPRADFPLTWYYIDRPRHHGVSLDTQEGNEFDSVGMFQWVTLLIMLSSLS